MFQQPHGRKRGRESDDEFSPQGFHEHRMKRHIASLPIRRSPEHKKRFLPTFQTNSIAPKSPTFADITPAGSDSEDVPHSNELRSFFSPWSSPLDQTLHSSQPSSCCDRSQPTQMQDTQAYSDDLEMTDSSLLYPGPFQPDSSTSIAGRIPTPIHSQFSSYIRSSNKAIPRLDQSMITSESVIHNDTTPDPSRSSRRLPSPISEDEAISPSSLLQSLGDVQMEVEDLSDTVPEEPKAAPKKGHTRSKYSLRDCAGLESEMGGVGVRRGFSMGYRSDCEKCRMRVPGHFSHVITY